MPFVNALFLIGTAAATIPLVLHLIHTTRAPQAPFPTLRFLRLAAEKTARRRRVQNVFLLALRMLLFALLAVALARPFVSPDVALLGGGGGLAAVLLDNSMSQGVTSGGRSRLEQSKREAERLLTSSLAPRQTLLVMSDATRDAGAETVAAPAGFSQSTGDVIRAIRQSEVGARRADLPGMLRTAYEAFDATGAADRRIYLFTDWQAQSWADAEALDLVADHGDIPVCVIAAKNTGPSNAAVIDIRATGVDRAVGFAVPIEVRLWSTGDLKGQRTVTLYIDDMNRPRESKNVTLPIVRGRNDRLIFKPSFRSPGCHRVRVEIKAEDSLPVDNARRLVVEIAGRVRALLVRDPRGLTGVDDPTFYLRKVLASPGGTGGSPWSIETRTVAPSELTDASLDRADTVIMADVAGVTGALLERLTPFVAGGGTLIVFAGPSTVASRWTRPAGEGAANEDLLPAALGMVRNPVALGRAPAKVVRVGQFGDMLTGLDDLRYYQKIVVSRYHVLRPLATSNGNVLLALDSGDPLVVAGRRGKGRVLVFAVPASGDWSNLQRWGNIFVPLMLRLVHSAAGRTAWPDQCVSGNVLQVDYEALSGRLGPFEIRVADPDNVGSPRQIKPNSGTVATFTIRNTRALGFYEVSPATSPPRPEHPWTFAVNPDGRESDLTPIDEAALRKIVPARELYVATSVADLESQLKSLGRTELWQPFLLAVLLLALFECLISNQLPAHPRRAGIQTLVDRLRGRVAPGSEASEESPRP